MIMLDLLDTHPPSTIMTHTNNTMVSVRSNDEVKVSQTSCKIWQLTVKKFRSNRQQSNTSTKPTYSALFVGRVFLLLSHLFSTKQDGST
jgi:hypothetical protein